jgi:hypothetical protein
MKLSLLNFTTLAFSFTFTLFQTNLAYPGDDLHRAPLSSNESRTERRIDQLILKEIPFPGFSLQESQQIAWNVLIKLQSRALSHSKEAGARIVFKKAILLFNQGFAPKESTLEEVTHEILQDLESFDLNETKLSTSEKRKVFLWKAQAIAQCDFDIPGLSRKEAAQRAYDLYEKAYQLQPSDEIRKAQFNLTVDEGFNFARNQVSDPSTLDGDSELGKSLNRSRYLGDLIAKDQYGRLHTFEEYELSGENFNCAFNGLGVTRQAAVQKLLDNSHRSTIRKLVAPDIISALTVGIHELPDFEADDRLPAQIRDQVEFIQLHEEFVAAQFKLDQKVRSANKRMKSLTKGKRLGALDLLALDAEGQNEYLDSLRNAMRRVEENREKIRRFAEREDIFRAYVQHYIGGHVGGNPDAPYFMLTYVLDHDGQQTSAIDAIAYLFGIRLEILASSAADETLKWVHRFDPSEFGVPIQKTVLLRNRDGYSHFNLLRLKSLSGKTRKHSEKESQASHPRKLKRMRTASDRQDKTFSIREGSRLIYTSLQSSLINALLEDPDRLDRAEVQLLKPIEAHQFPLSTWSVRENTGIVRIIRNHPDSKASQAYLSDPRPSNGEWQVFLRRKIETDSAQTQTQTQTVKAATKTKSRGHGTSELKQLARRVQEKEPLEKLMAFAGYSPNERGPFMRRLGECYRFGFVTSEEALYLKLPNTTIGGRGQTKSKIKAFLERRSQGVPTESIVELLSEYNSSDQRQKRSISYGTFVSHITQMYQKGDLSEEVYHFFKSCMRS